MHAAQTLTPHDVSSMALLEGGWGSARRLARLDEKRLSTAESVVLDGANAVTHAPRMHFPQGGPFVAFAVIVVVVARALFTRGPKWALPVLLGIAALPGLYEVLVARPDAPMHRAEMTAEIASTLGAMQRLAPWPGSVAGEEDDDVLFPLSRYAIPGRKPLGVPGPILETHGSKLDVPCTVDGRHVRCGVAL